jgi:hypothetical protein
MIYLEIRKKQKKLSINSRKLLMKHILSNQIL